MILLKDRSILYILIAWFLFFSFYVVPTKASAQSATPNTGITYECNTGGIIGNCSYLDLIAAVKRVIDWMIIFTLQFSVIVIVYAGFNYMVSGDNPSKRSDANRMLRKVATGIFFVLAAWLIVTLVANTLLTDDVKKVTPVTPN